MDRTIVFERMTATPNDYGTVVEDWTALATMRAERVRNAVNDALGESGSETTATLQFRTWFFDGLTLDDRVSFEGAAYRIKRIDEIGRRRGLNILVERIGP